MKKGLTELVFILDRSGSMAGLEADTIGGFNSMMERQKKEEGEALVSLVLFDDQCEVVCDRIPVEQVKALTDKEYYVRGCTALLDALGGAVHHIGKLHKHEKEEERPEKTIFVITTDGQENSSRKYQYEKLKKMIQRKQEKQGWEFLFLGANIDAIGEAAKMGIRADRAVRYKCDKKGTSVVFDTLSETVCMARSQSMPLSADWKESIEEDYKERANQCTFR